MKQQQGIALITILVMVALATIIAATIAKRQTHTFENTAYLMRQNQALYYAKSAEAFLAEILVQDHNNGANVDHLQETWAQPMPVFPVEDGFVSGELKDESGKFNLNSLLNSDGTENPQTKLFFEKLLVRVGLPAELSQAVIDWQDADDLTTGAMGAESNYYQGLPNSYLAANTQFHQIEELKQVRGFEGDKFALIAPYVSALPDTATKININTAPALVLAALDEKIDVNTVDAALKAKQAKLEHFSNVNALITMPPFDAMDAAEKALASQIFDVKSNYFKANIEVLLSNRKRQLTSYMLRKDKSVVVYARSLAPF